MKNTIKPESVSVIPALSGYFTVYDLETTIEVGEPVIAWRIETYEKQGGDELFSTCTALTVDGDMVSNCIGIQNPDKTITIFQESTYGSLKELNQEKYPSKHV